MTIQYVDCTWSPLVGCQKCSPGCAQCYAARLAATRLSHLPKYRDLATMRTDVPNWNGNTHFCPYELEKPLRWRKPRRIFCCDMGDIALATVDELERIYHTISACQQHTFLILTKRPVVLLGKMGTIVTPPNVHFGVTAEDQTRFDERVPWLLRASEPVRWLSLEPLLGPIDLTKTHAPWREPGFACEREVYPLIGTMAIPDCDRDVGKVDWVVVGAENGPNPINDSVEWSAASARSPESMKVRKGRPGRRPCKLEWVESIVRQCDRYGVPVFVKQLDLGGRVSKDPNEWPEWARRRELPPARSRDV